MCVPVFYIPKVNVYSSRDTPGQGVRLSVPQPCRYIDYLCLGLAWLALILNTGVGVMEPVIGQTHPGFKKQEEDERTSSRTCQRSKTGNQMRESTHFFSVYINDTESTQI